MNDSTSPKAPSRPRIGVSACLLGKNVRFDGGHRRDRFVDDRLGRFVDFVPVCPEVESGLPVPRESLRLVGSVARRSSSPRRAAPITPSGSSPGRVSAPKRSAGSSSMASS